MSQKWREAAAKYRARRDFPARVAKLAKELEVFFTGEEGNDAKDLLEACEKMISIALIIEVDAPSVWVFLDEHGLRGTLQLPLSLQGVDNEVLRKSAFPFADFQKLATVITEDEKRDPEKILPEIRAELDRIAKHAYD